MEIHNVNSIGTLQQNGGLLTVGQGVLLRAVNSSAILGWDAEL